MSEEAIVICALLACIAVIAVATSIASIFGGN